MSDRNHQDTHLTPLSAGRVSSYHLTSTPGSAPAGQHHPPALLPSPPFSPQQRKAEEFKHHSRHSSLQDDRCSMLHVSSQENAKLDVNRLLQAEPSPPPSSSGAEASHSIHSRSNSVPLPKHQHFPSGSLHRTSVSASAVLPSAAHSSGLPPLTSQPPFSTHALGSSQRPTLPPIQPPPSLPPSQSSLPAPSPYGPPGTPYQHQTPHFQVRPPSPHHVPSKRPAPVSTAPPAKRQSKWTPEEDALIIELRGGGMKWEEISKRLPGRSAISCRLHYQNYLERRSEWDEERKNRLARLYERLKPEMWGSLAAELGIPWRAAEAMHWQLGEVDMARRAGVVPFSLAAASSVGATAPPLPSGAAPPNPYGQSSPEAYGARPVRAGSLGRRPEEMSYPPRPDPRMMSGPPPLPSAMPPASGGMLPSLAELERGRAAYDIPDPSMPRYSSAGGPAYGTRR